MDINTHLNLDPHLQLKLIEFKEKTGSLTEFLKIKRL